MSTVPTHGGTPLVERSTARKVIGSLAILGTAAAVAGLGTYGNFTDSTTPLNTTVDTGALSIDLTQPAGAVASRSPPPASCPVTR